MSILYLLIPLSLILLGLAVWAFFWAVKHDQFEDLEGPAYRILFDEDENDRPRQTPAASETEAEPGADAPRDEDRRNDGRRDDGRRD